jgi:predicted metalloprotease with PDZ domain
MARDLGFGTKAEGVLIVEVEVDSVANGAGLRRGMLILQVDQQRTVAEAQKALAKGSLEKGVVLQVRTSHGGTTYVLLKAPTSR